jgi:hypothetical protein
MGYCFPNTVPVSAFGVQVLLSSINHVYSLCASYFMTTDCREYGGSRLN